MVAFSNSKSLHELIEQKMANEYQSNLPYRTTSFFNGMFIGMLENYNMARLERGEEAINPRWYEEELSWERGGEKFSGILTGSSMVKIEEGHKSSKTHRSIANESNTDDEFGVFINIKAELANCKNLSIEKFKKLAQRYKSQEDTNQATPIILLVRTLQKENLINLLKAAARNGYGAEMLGLNLADKNGRTALHYAYALGQVEIVEYLERFPGINKDAKDINGNTPIQWAQQLQGNEKEVNQLLAKLEMHPMRDENAKENAIEHENATYGGSSLMLLQSKTFLEELQECDDLPVELREKINRILPDLSGISISQRCMEGLDILCSRNIEKQQQQSDTIKDQPENFLTEPSLETTRSVDHNKCCSIS